MTYEQYIARCKAQGTEPIGRAMFDGPDHEHHDELLRRDEIVRRPAK